MREFFRGQGPSAFRQSGTHRHPRASPLINLFGGHCRYYSVVRNTFLSRLGQRIAVLIFIAGAGAGAFIVARQEHPSAQEPLPFPLVVTCLAGMVAVPIAFAVGRVVGLLLARVPIRRVALGAPPALIRFRLGQTQVELGPVLMRYRITNAIPAARWRIAVIHISGPLGNLAAAGVFASIPAVRPYGTAIALIVGAYGVAPFVPFRTKTGMPSAGYGLILLARMGRAEAGLRRLTSEPGWPERPELLKYLLTRRDAAAYTSLLFTRLGQENRTGELAEWHARLWGHAAPLLPGMNARAEQRLAHILHSATDGLLNRPDVPREAAEHGEKYLEWAIPRLPEDYRPAAKHSLAVADLRQGRFAEVEPLCTPLLSGDLMPEHRATVLATIVLARSALGLESRRFLEEAISLAPDADLVGEASAAVSTADAADNPTGPELTH